MNVLRTFAGTRRLIAVACAIGGAVGCRPQGPPVNGPPAGFATEGWQGGTDPREVYRRRAGGAATAVRLAAEDPGVGPDARGRLQALVDDHLRAVDAELARFGQNLPAADRLIAAADDSAERFEQAGLKTWADARPEARSVVERRFGIWEAVGQALVHDPERLVAAASAAGLPHDRLADASRLAADARARLKEWGDAGEAHQQRIELLPAADARALAEAAFEHDHQRTLFDAGRTTYEALRRLFPQDRHTRLDEALLEMDLTPAEDAER